MEIERRGFKNSELRAKSGDAFGINGHAAVFDSLSEDLGGWREIIRPGAFANSIARDDIRFLVEHEGSALARNVSGTMKLSEDDVGLKVEADFDLSDPDVQRLKPKVERGDLSQMSFGFFTLRHNWDLSGPVPVRELLEAQLFDVSAVTYPAYLRTDIATRGAQIAEARSLLNPSPPENNLFRIKLLRRRGEIQAQL
jgi:uncharacterized protein